MADKKISQLTASTTPLAGTEVIPIVQSGATVKVSVANLTAGRSISTAGASLDGAVVINDSGADVDFRVEGDTNQNLLVVDASADRVGVNNATPAAKLDVVGPYDANAPSTSSVPAFRVNEGGALSLWVSGQAYSNVWLQAIQDDGSNNLKQLVLQPLGGGVAVGGDVSVNTGNLVIGTSGKGIDFSADGQAAGMTSELLDDYEEGTWTPNVGGDATYTIQAGSYTKIGRQVTVQFDLQINVIGTGSLTTISGLPFSAAAAPISAGGGNVVYFASLNTNVYAPPMPRVDAGASTLVFTAVEGFFPDVNPTLNIFKSGARVFGFATYTTSA